MKTIIRFLFITFLLTATLWSGCATTGKTLASTATVVDRAMEGWATYVVLTNVSDERQAPVMRAYAKYQSSMELATNLYKQSAGQKTDALKVAIKVLKDNQRALIKLIDSFDKR